MSKVYLCTAVPRSSFAGVVPGKLVDSSDQVYAALVSYGALLWPSSDSLVAAAAKLAQRRHLAQADNVEALQTIMLAGVAQSLSQGGGQTRNVTATFASHPALAQSANQLQPLDSSGGAFTQPFPPTPNVGDVVLFEDWAPSGSGIFENIVTLDGGTIPVQNKRTLAVSSGVTTYAFGGTNQDGDGSTVGFRCAANGTIAKFWKVM